MNETQKAIDAQCEKAGIPTYSDLLSLLEQAAGLLNRAFEFEGDVFGTMHNDAIDVLAEIETVTDK